MAKRLAGFNDPVTIRHEGVALPVYTSVEGEKPLIVLHELPGMSEPFLVYCRRMAGKGYRVVMPLFSGEPGRKMSSKESRAFCVSQEFRDLFEASQGGEARPFTAWLLHLTRRVIEENPKKKVGVIGMCLTGGFALTTIAEEGVHAAVACQPAYPFFRKIRTLGLSADEREQAATRARALHAEEGRPCLEGYRYRWDVFCRPAHLRAARRIFGPAFDRHRSLPGGGHSTVTREPPDERVMESIDTFLDKRL